MYSKQSIHSLISKLFEKLERKKLKESVSDIICVNKVHNSPENWDFKLSSFFVTCSVLLKEIMLRKLIIFFESLSESRLPLQSQINIESGYIAMAIQLLFDNEFRFKIRKEFENLMFKSIKSSNEYVPR